MTYQLPLSIYSSVQVHNHRKEDEKTSSLEDIEKEFNPKDFIIPELVRPGLGQNCDYCVIKTGYSVSFTSFRKYIEHVIWNHQGYTPYAFPAELDKFRKSLPMTNDNDYQKKLKERYKDNLKRAKTVIPRARPRPKSSRHKVAEMEEPMPEDKIKI